MLVNSIISTEGSLLTPFQVKKKFLYLKKDPLNNFLWKSLKQIPSHMEKNKNLSTFKQRILNF